MSQDAREKMRKAALGNTRRKGTKTSEQGLANIKASAIRRSKCIKVSAETCAKISASNKGRVRSAETRKRISEGRKGIKFSEEHRQSLKENSGNRGKRCITNGVNNKYISSSDIVPDGWRLGVTRKR
jgi:hypothetical protein